MKLGTLVTLKKEDDIDAKIEKVSALGFEYCQISCWDMEAYTDEIAEKILAALEKYDVKITWLTREDKDGKIYVNELACYAWARHYAELYPDADPALVMAIIKTESDLWDAPLPSTFFATMRQDDSSERIPKRSVSTDWDFRFPKRSAVPSRETAPSE